MDDTEVEQHPTTSTQWDAARRPSPEGRPHSGTSPGVNIIPGHEDDGWVVPSPVRLTDGTLIQLSKDGEALHAAFDVIRAAKRRIALEVYIFHSDPTGRAFADLLAAKAKEGIPTYVIYDALGSVHTDPAMFDRMACAGVRLAKFHPIKPWECKYSWRPWNRDHRKLLLADDDQGWLGGLNIGGEYAGSWIVGSPQGNAPWRDNAISLRGPSARLLVHPFVKTWKYIHNGGHIGQTEYLHNVHQGEFGVAATTPTRRNPIKMLRVLLDKAQSSILLTMAYFAPPDDLIDDLCRAARRRVRVRLMLPGQCDVKILMTAARSFYEKLLLAGVEVYERQGAVLHAKSLCVDGETTILGSTNLDERSIELNCELSVIIRNSEFAKQMHALFDHDILFAHRITLKKWRRRPVLDRVTQWAVMRARYLL